MIKLALKTKHSPLCRKKRESNNESVRKIRAKKKEEKEKTEKRMGELRRENEEIEQRTAVHAQVRQSSLSGGYSFMLPNYRFPRT